MMEQSRIVTLLGPGGAGKTRLAMRSAACLSRVFPDGIWLAEFGSLIDDSLVVQTVGHAVAAGLTSQNWTEQMLTEHLDSKRLMLLLDGCEHVIEAAARVVVELTRTCPQVHVLATSRQTLGVDGEARFQVPPLSVPPLDQRFDVDAAADSDAIRLFAERARSATRTFELTAGNLPAVHRLCWQLDGIPLAIELAAARVAALEVDEILNRLDDRFSLLASSSPVAPPHQRTLDATMEWSYGLLSRPERILWRRLAAFSGTFSLSAAEAVCGDDQVASRAVAGLLSGLVEKSMVARVAHDGPSRFRVLETLKHLAIRKLTEAGERPFTQRRHCEWVCAIAQGPEQPGSGRPDWFAMLDEEMPNVRSALEYCLTSPAEAGRGLDICTGAWAYWRVRGPIAEARRWLQSLLRLDNDCSHRRAKALWVAGAFAVLQNDRAGGEPLLLASSRMGEVLGSNAIRGTAAYYLGLASYFAGDLEAAESWAGESSRFHRRDGNRFGEALVQEFLGQVALARGEATGAIDVLMPALTTSRQLGEVWLEAYVLWVLSLAHWRLGTLEQAQVLASQSLELHRSIGERTGTALTTEALAWFAMTRHDAKQAARLLGAAERIWQTNNTTIYGPLKEYHDACEAGARTLLGERLFTAVHGSEGPGRGRRAGTPAPGPRATSILSRRELQIANLIAAGLSNQRIASRLLLSKRTIDSHVDHILTKLGQRSRVQIALWAKEHQDPSTPAGKA